MVDDARDRVDRGRCFEATQARGGDLWVNESRVARLRHPVLELQLGKNRLLLRAALASLAL